MRALPGLEVQRRAQKKRTCEWRLAGQEWMGLTGWPRDLLTRGDLEIGSVRFNQPCVNKTGELNAPFLSPPNLFLFPPFCFPTPPRVIRVVKVRSFHLTNRKRSIARRCLKKRRQQVKSRRGKQGPRVAEGARSLPHTTNSCKQKWHV